MQLFIDYRWSSVLFGSLNKAAAVRGRYNYIISRPRHQEEYVYIYRTILQYNIESMFMYSSMAKGA